MDKNMNHQIGIYNKKHKQHKFHLQILLIDKWDYKRSYPIAQEIDNRLRGSTCIVVGMDLPITFHKGLVCTKLISVGSTLIPSRRN